MTLSKPSQRFLTLDRGKKKSRDEEAHLENKNTVKEEEKKLISLAST